MNLEVKGIILLRESCVVVERQGAAIEVLERIQVSRLIHVVWLSGWLPESLACSKEVVHAIDGAFIPDLLLLVWRCMHDALAAALKAWDGNQTESVKSFGVSKAVPVCMMQAFEWSMQ